MSQFFGHDHKEGSPDTTILITVDPSAIVFKRGTNVGQWKKIQDQFRGCLSAPGEVVDWEKEQDDTIYTRLLEFTVMYVLFKMNLKVSS